MYINDVLVDSVLVHPSHNNQVHVNHFKHQLLQKHSHQLSEEENAPVFTLEGVPSRLNEQFTSLIDTYDVLKKDDPLFPPSKKHKE